MNMSSLISRNSRKILFLLVVFVIVHTTIRFVIFTKTSLRENKFSSSPSSAVIRPKEANNTASSVCSCKAFTRYRENWHMKNIGCPKDEITVKAVLKTPGGNIPIYVYPKKMDVWVSGFIIAKGSWESDLSNRVYDILSKDKSLDFVDIGANVGVYTMTIAKMGRRVLAIEALPQNARKLCKSVQEAKFSQPVPVIVNNVVSDKRRRFGFGFYPGNIGGTYVVEKKKNDNSSNEVVESVLLDDVLEIFPLKNVFMKIDVERHERQVLKGAREFFKKVNVKYILMEMSFATEDDRNRADEVMQFLEDQKLKPFWPDNPLTPLTLRFAGCKTCADEFYDSADKEIARSLSTIELGSTELHIKDEPF